jgi:cob(I)alamin adenosyltransferase
MKIKIYTKTGDDGTTGLVGGTRVKKSELRLETYGTVDELNAWIGLIRSMTADNKLIELLVSVQNILFTIGSKLATDEKGKPVTEKLRVESSDILKLEEAIDSYEEELLPLRNFILPGGSQVVSYCHIARTVCRRAERRIVQLSQTIEVDFMILQYINRLSDYLFVLSRKLAHDTDTGELNWSHK